MDSIEYIFDEVKLLFIQKLIDTIEGLKLNKDDLRKCLLRALGQLNYDLQESIDYDYDDLDEDRKDRLKILIQFVYEYFKKEINKVFSEF